MKKINRFVSAEQFQKVISKRGLSCSLKRLNKLKHGDFLVMIHNIEKHSKTFYFLKKIFIRPFDMSYSCIPKTRSGKELFISNFYIPKVKLDRDYNKK